MLPEVVPGLQRPQTGALLDRFGRKHDYLRISVTDRCNYRCTYCMPASGMNFLPKGNILSFEEIIRITSVLARCGVHHVRLTGGEPTVRRGIEDLVRGIAQIPGIDDLSMTTNGHLFAPMASALANAGLRRVNISIDSLDSGQFRSITRGGDLAKVIAAIHAARELGLTPIKLNAVMVGGENEDQLRALVAFASDFPSELIVRFIEFMPFDGNDRDKKHIPASVLRERLGQSCTLVPAAASGGGPARYWRIQETGLIVGFISPITEHFCQLCNRLRLQADGHLRTCLSREAAPSLRDILRKGVSDEDLETVLRERLWGKVAGHEAHLDNPRAFEGVMTAIGG